MSLSVRHACRWPDIHNVSRKDKSGRCSPVNLLKASFDTNGSVITQRYAVDSISYAAYRADVVRSSNRVSEFQDSFIGVLIICARCKRFSSAWRVSCKVAVESPARAIRIKSRFGAMFGINVRIASRNSRFARLRITAVPTDLPAATPTRTCGWSFFFTINTTSGWA